MLIASTLLLLAPLLFAQEAGHGAHDGHHPERTAEEWIAALETPDRDDWQKPAEVLRLLDAKPGQTVADIGAGSGYFNRHLAGAVGGEGKVLALDIDAELVAHMTARAAAEQTPQVVAVQVDPADPGLAVDSVDRAIVVNTWHHISDRVAYAAKVHAALRPGGALLVIEPTLDGPIGPKPDHRMSPEAVVAELAAAGFDASVLTETLPHQYAVMGRVSDTSAAAPASDLAKTIAAAKRSEREGLVRAELERAGDDRERRAALYGALSVITELDGAPPATLQAYLSAVLDGSPADRDAALVAARKGGALDAEGRPTVVALSAEELPVAGPEPGTPAHAAAQLYAERWLVIGPTATQDELVEQAKGGVAMSNLAAVSTAGSDVAAGSFSDSITAKVSWTVWQGAKDRLSAKDFERLTAAFSPARLTRSNAIHKAFDRDEARRVVEAYNAALLDELALDPEQVGYLEDSVPWTAFVEGTVRVWPSGRIQVVEIEAPEP